MDPDLGTFIPSNSFFDLIAFCDIDWGRCPNTGCSIGGYYITLGGSPISWKSKKESLVSLSSVEAEYRSMWWVMKEITWLVRLLADFGVPSSLHVPPHSYSQAAIDISKYPVFHKRTKHVDLDCHLCDNNTFSGSFFWILSFTCSISWCIHQAPYWARVHRSFLDKLGIVSPSSNLIRGRCWNVRSN